MTETMIVAIFGMIAIGVFGFLGRRGPASGVAEWTVASRKFGAVTTFFLQAGEVFTTFTFLGLTGLAYATGVPAVYALGYIPLQYLILYLVAPKLWTISRDHGYVGQPDFLAGQYRSKVLGCVAAVMGFAFLLPYLQLQITGLGLIVQLATGQTGSATLSMAIGTLLVVGFVMWAGIRGVAATAYLKDILMVVMLAITAIAIFVHYTGGLGRVFDQVADQAPAMLGLQPGSHDIIWFITNLGISVIGAGFAAFPYTWPGILGARSARIIQRNFIVQPIYALCVVVPISIGFVGILALDKTAAGNGNGTLLTLARDAMPGWLLGLLVVAGIATAMVPSGALLVAMSSMFARNIVQVRGDKQQYWLGQVMVVVTALIALLLAIQGSNALANLALLTFSGLSQLVPSIVAALRRSGPVIHAWSAVAGLVAGVAVVAMLTFTSLSVGTWNVGVIGLGVNIVVVAIVEAVLRASRGAPLPHQPVSTGGVA